MATTALGGLTARSRVAATFACLVAAGLGVPFVSYPLMLDLLRVEPVFDRPVTAADLAAALATNVLGAGVGGAVGVLCSPPRIRRRANSAAAAVAMLLALVSVSGQSRDFGGPVATAGAISRAAPGHITAAEAAGWASSALVIGLMLLASSVIDGRRA